MTTQETEGLVRALRLRAHEHRGFLGSAKDYRLFEEAADRLQALEAERDSLIAAVGEHVTVRSDYYAHLQRVKELEEGLEP